MGGSAAAIRRPDRQCLANIAAGQRPPAAGDPPRTATAAPPGGRVLAQHGGVAARLPAMPRDADACGPGPPAEHAPCPPRSAATRGTSALPYRLLYRNLFRYDIRTERCRQAAGMGLPDCTGNRARLPPARRSSPPCARLVVRPQPGPGRRRGGALTHRRRRLRRPGSGSGPAGPAPRSQSVDSHRVCGRVIKRIPALVAVHKTEGRSHQEPRSTTGRRLPQWRHRRHCP
jgi:hypothetical protein